MEPPPLTSDSRYSIGNQVVVTAESFPGHTRCPAYIRSKTGTIVRIYPLANIPEWRAHTKVRCKEHTYAVEFQAVDLWPDGERGSTVVVELFESYLSPEETRLRA
jgi:nitrile hydratase subunit beta